MIRRKRHLSLNGGVFVAELMMVGLKTAPATFQCITTEIFNEYIPTFMQVFLDDIVSQEGISMDPDNVEAILNAPAPSTAKALNRFLGQIRWHSRMLRHLADFATPLHTAVHRLPFQWSAIEDKAYQSLKLMLSHAPVVQPSVWLEPFHVFVDASDIAIGSALMQSTPPNRY